MTKQHLLDLLESYPANTELHFRIEDGYEVHECDFCDVELTDDDEPNLIVAFSLSDDYYVATT